MAVEGLVLVHPTDASKNVTLNGTKWALEELDLGNPGRREELIGSIDASGAVPFRVAPRDNREVTLRLRLIDAATMDAAMNSIAALEAVLEAAERFASEDTDDPVLDHVRLVYTPADSTYSFSLIVYAAEITGAPKTLSGDDAGWFIKRPVLTVRAICDPFAYGAGVSSPTRTTWLDTTISGTDGASSVTVPSSGSIAGDVAPFTRVVFEDDASMIRNRLIVGLRRGESSTTPTIEAASLTAVIGTVAAGVMTATSTEWAVAAQLPEQTRTGTFRVFLRDATSASSGSVRFIAAPAGSSRRTGPTVTVTDGTTIDADLGEVSMDSKWNGWIETDGSVKFDAVILVPTDSYIDVTSAAPGKQLVGALSVSDGFATSANLDGDSLTAGTDSGTWTVNGTSSTPFEVDGTIAERSSSSMTAPAVAYAGTTDYLNVNLDATIQGFTQNLLGSPAVAQTHPFVGIFARRNDDTTQGDLLIAGLAIEAGLGNASAGVWKRIGTTLTRIYQGQVRSWIGWGLTAGPNLKFRFQTTEDGRWYLGVGTTFDGPDEVASGSDPDLASGGTLGDSAEARVGLYHYATASTIAGGYWSGFRVSALTGVTPPPIPADDTLTLAGPKLLTEDGSEHPYNGSSGLALRPAANNNLTALVRRPSNAAGAGAAATEPLGVTVSGWPRYLTVPHG